MTAKQLLDRTALFVNGASRTGTNAYGPVREALLDRGVNLLRAEAVKDPNTLPQVIRRAAEDGCRLIVVGGGDGSVGPAAGVLADLAPVDRPVLAVIPLGTANDFARTLDIPDDIEGAADIVAGGRIVDIDLGRANNLPYVNVASLGLSVGSAQALKPGLKQALGPVAYPVSTVVAYGQHEPFTVRLEFPDGDHEAREVSDLLQVSIGNGRYYGGGHTIAPNAEIDDQSLDVFLIKAGRISDHLSLSKLLREGSVVEHEDVEHLTTCAVRLTADVEQPVDVDGEIITQTPVDFRLERNAFEVVAPRHLPNVSHDSSYRDDEGNSRSTSAS